MNIPFQYTSQAEDLSKHMNRAFLEKNVENSNNIETPVQLLEFMKNFTPWFSIYQFWDSNFARTYLQRPLR